jgi:hypothetical protein
MMKARLFRIATVAASLGMLIEVLGAGKKWG